MGEHKLPKRPSKVTFPKDAELKLFEAAIMLLKDSQLFDDRGESWTDNTEFENYEAAWKSARDSLLALATES